MIWQLAAAAAAAYLLWNLIRFVRCELLLQEAPGLRASRGGRRGGREAERLPGECRADADLHLLSKRRPPAGAFRDKVIWIVGASQVGGWAGVACATRSGRLGWGMPALG